MSWTGTLRKADLGAGAWVLETGGERVMLVGDVPEHLADQRVKVRGKQVEAMGFAMTGGKTVEVTGIEKA